MARVANARHAYLQQLRITAAVRVVAVRAVLHDRRMLPKEGSSTFRVATEAILINRGLDQLRGIRASVWIMAAGAGDFAFPIGHMRGALKLRAAHLVALQAQFGLAHGYAAVVCQRLVVTRV